MAAAPAEYRVGKRSFRDQKKKKKEEDGCKCNKNIENLEASGIVLFATTEGVTKGKSHRSISERCASCSGAAPRS